MWSKDSGTAEISFVIISKFALFVKNYFCFFQDFLGNIFPR